MIEDHDLYVMDRAFLEYGTYEIKIKARPELLVAAVMMCKFMAHNKLDMRRAGIPGALMEECFKSISSPLPHSKP